MSSVFLALHVYKLLRKCNIMHFGGGLYRSEWLLLLLIKWLDRRGVIGIEKRESQWIRVMIDSQWIACQFVYYFPRWLKRWVAGLVNKFEVTIDQVLLLRRDEFDGQENSPLFLEDKIISDILLHSTYSLTLQLQRCESFHSALFFRIGNTITHMCVFYVHIMVKILFPACNLAANLTKSMVWKFPGRGVVDGEGKPNPMAGRCACSGLGRRGCSGRGLQHQA